MPEIQAGVFAPDEELRTSRQPLSPVQPVRNEQRSRTGAPVPEVQTGEDKFPAEKVRMSRVAPEMRQPLQTEQRSRRVSTTTRRQVQDPVEVSARMTRLSAKRGSRVLECD